MRRKIFSFVKYIQPLSRARVPELERLVSYSLKKLSNIETHIACFMSRVLCLKKTDGCLTKCVPAHGNFSHDNFSDHPASPGAGGGVAWLESLVEGHMLGYMLPRMLLYPRRIFHVFHHHVVLHVGIRETAHIVVWGFCTGERYQRLVWIYTISHDLQRNCCKWHAL